MLQLFVGVGNPLTLARCRRLQELKINASEPAIAELNLISTIASTSIQRIVFSQTFVSQRLPAPDHPDWTRLDRSLCQLIGGSEQGLLLNVEFQALDTQAWWDGELGFRKHLPRFCETRGGRSTTNEGR